MIKKITTLLVLGGVIVANTSSLLQFQTAAASSSPRDVVINEVAWAGSGDSSSDEWIELYNNTNGSIDVTNWVIEDDNGTSTYPLHGVIPANGYFLLENRESSTSIAADELHSLSLSNAGDSLVLKDTAGTIVDSANGASAAWPAGNVTAHASMERIRPISDGNSSNSWQTSSATSNATASSGGSIHGSPKEANGSSSNGSGTTGNSTSVSISSDKSNLNIGEEISVNIGILNAVNVSNFGLDITYDSHKLRFLRASEGAMLSANASIATSFHAALVNDHEGEIIVGNARTQSPLTGVNGNGTLANLIFSVLPDSAPGSSAITLNPTSFISNPTSHISLASWPQLTVNVNSPTPEVTVSGLTAKPGNDRYSVELNWTPASTTGYQFQVYRRNTHHQYQLLGTTSENSFIDHDTVSNGGNIVPEQEYEYQVIAINNGIASTPGTISVSDTRGIRGDNDRSDRVDGMDLENIARLWTTDDTQNNFSPLVDTSYDGMINGSDLIDLAATWARTYS